MYYNYSYISSLGFLCIGKSIYHYFSPPIEIIQYLPDCDAGATNI